MPTKAFDLDLVQSVNLFLSLDSIFGVPSKKYLPDPRHKSYFKELLVFKLVLNQNSNALFRENPQSLIYSYFL